MRKIIFILFIFPLMLSGQDVDSLKLLLKTAKHDTTRCNVLAILAEVASEEEWPAFNEQLKIIAEKNVISGGSGKYFYLKHLVNAFNNKGFLAQEEGDFKSANDFFLKALKIAEEISEKKGIAVTLNNLGLISNSQGDIQGALNYHHRSLKISEEINDKSAMALSYNNIGYIYTYQGETEKGLEYFQKSLNIYSETGDNYGRAMCLNNMSGIYGKQNNMPRAKECLEKSLLIRRQINDEKGIAYCLSNLGVIYEKEGDSKSASKNYYESLKIREKVGDKAGLANSLNNIANLEFKNGEIQKALTYANKSMEVSQELGFPVVILNSAETLKRIFQQQKKYKESYEMYELEVKMRDSINNEQTQKAAVRKQLQYTYEKKEAVAQAEHKLELEKQQAIADEKQRKQNIVIWSVVIGLILVIAFAAYVLKTLRVTRKQKLVIEIKSKEVEEKQREILDSIQYAKRIQRALIPSDRYIERNLNRLKRI